MTKRAILTKDKPLKSQYRNVNIQVIKGGGDYYITKPSPYWHKTKEKLDDD